MHACGATFVREEGPRTKYGLGYRYFWPIPISQACISQACISQACISQACTSQACISQACISQACISQACISQACISQASISQACISQASISQVYIYYPTVLLLNRPARCVLATGERDGQKYFRSYEVWTEVSILLAEVWIGVSILLADTACGATFVRGEGEREGGAPDVRY